MVLPSLEAEEESKEKDDLEEGLLEATSEDIESLFDSIKVNYSTVRRHIVQHDSPGIYVVSAVGVCSHISRSRVPKLFRS